MSIKSFLEKLGLLSSLVANGVSSRRKHVRHPGIHAEIQVANRIYSVHDWSLGGLFFEAPADALMTVGDKVVFDIKFRLPHETITISQTAQVVRAVKRGIAAEFVSMPKTVRRQFERVIDSFNTQSFIDSQIA